MRSCWIDSSLLIAGRQAIGRTSRNSPKRSINMSAPAAANSALPLKPPTKPQVTIPAARPAYTSTQLSPIMTPSAGAQPQRRAASINGCGAGLRSGRLSPRFSIAGQLPRSNSESRTDRARAHAASRCYACSRSLRSSRRGIARRIRSVGRRGPGSDLDRHRIGSSSRADGARTARGKKDSRPPILCRSPGRLQRRLLQRCWIEQTVPKDLAVILLLIIAEMVRLTDIHATMPRLCITPVTQPSGPGAKSGKHTLTKS